MTTNILEELFEKIAEVFNLSFALDKDKYLTYLFNMASAFANRGVYGSTIEWGISAQTPGRAMIRRKIRTIATLFSLTVDAATLICEKEIFVYVNETKKITIARVNKITDQLEKTLINYWDFLCVGFLGHVFNQNIRLKNEINNFHDGWVTIIKKIVKAFWGDDEAVKEVAEKSIIYLLGSLSKMKSLNHDERQVKALCSHLRKYWIKEYYLL